MLLQYVYVCAHGLYLSEVYTKITTDITTAINNIGARAVRLQVTVVDKCTTQTQSRLTHLLHKVDHSVIATLL